MARAPTSTAVVEPITNNGLHFMNSVWNDTIANGDLFHLNWNKNIHGIASDLGVFRMSFLDEGVIAYQLAIDLTDIVEDRTARWEPKDLNKTLYVFWLRTIGEDKERWAISPPWTPKDPPSKGFRWAVPIGIPISIMMGLYLISLVTCLFYRRRKKRRLERQRLNDRQRHERLAMLAAQQQRRRQVSDVCNDPSATDRHPSVSTVDTAQTLTEEDLQKPDIAVLLETPPRTSSRRPSNADLFGYVGQNRRPSHPDLFGYVGQSRRPSHPDLFVETFTERRRPSRPELYGEVSPTRRPSRPELFIDSLPETEVGKAL